MSKKATAIALTSLMVMNQISDVTLIHVNAQTQTNTSQQQSDKQTKQVVYLADGDGALTAGDGTVDKPYQNIRTALEQVAEGGTIKLVGVVGYSRYEEQPTTKEALPLMITKNVTIEGGTLYTRAPIQLAADVTFKDMHLEMPNLNQLFPGVHEAPPTPADERVFKSGRTIYLAGHTLTLDNVNTRLGTSMDQEDTRPFISGGTFWDTQQGIGTKSVVNIKNNNGETKFSSIYAGDYWRTSNIPFELNLDSTTNNKVIIDHTIHTGGIMNDYQGDVTINIDGATSMLSFDNTKHSGAIDVNITSDTYLDKINFNHVRNLTLSSNAYVELQKNSTFEVENLSINDNAVLDFRKVNGNPKVKGTFTGTTTVNATTQQTGAIILLANQTLEVDGLANGAVRLNSHDKITSQILRQNHPYMTAVQQSTAELIINPVNGQENLGLKIVQATNDAGLKTYSIVGDVSQTFKDFKFNGGEDQLINPKLSFDYEFPIEYINEFGETYTPDDVREFKLSVIKHADNDKVVTEDDLDNEMDIWFELSPIDGAVRLSFIAHYPEGNTAAVTNPYEGDLTLVLEHKDTGQKITKTITILKDNQNGTVETLAGTVKLEGNPKVGEILTAKVDGLSTNATGVKYKWMVGDQVVSDGTESTFTLKEEHIGKEVTVEVRTSNYAGKISSQAMTVLTNQLTGTVAISGTPQVGETLTVDTTALQADATGFNYQWYVNGVEIQGETGSQLLLKPEYFGQNITVEVKANNYQGSVVSSLVTVSMKNLTGTVEITGAPKVGETLVATPKNLTDASVKLSYQWYLDGVAIEGATQDKLEVKPEYAGKQIKVIIGSTHYLGTLSSSEVTIEKVNTPVQAPTINGLTKLVIRQGKTTDLKAGVTATDANNNDLTSQIVFPTVDVTTLGVGIHELEYSVKDANGLTTVMKRIIEVQTNQAPTILGLNTLTLNMREVDQFNNLHGVTVEDDHDQNLIPTVTGTITKPQPDQQMTSTLTYTVTDSDGNTTSLDRLITVTNYLPVLQANSITIFENEAIDLLKDPRIHVTATDLEDQDLTGHIQVKDSQGLDVNNPTQGVYKVTYTVTDLDGNMVEATINVNVQSNESPIIEGATATTLKLSEVDSFDPLDGVTVTDDHDQNLIPTVTGTIAKPKPGETLTSTLTYTVVDNEGNTTTLDRLITVTNHVPTLQVTPITIKANQAIDLLTDSRLQLSATDVEDGNITSQIKIKDLDGFNPNQPVEGDYNVTYMVTDLDQNTTEQTITIKVQPNYAPTLTGVENKTIQSGQSFEPLAGVKAFDPEEGELLNIEVDGSIDPYQLGEQSITYKVTDSDGNVTTVTRTITVIYQTEESTDSTISNIFVPHTAQQINQLVKDIKAYDSQAIIVEITEDANHYLYKIEIRRMTKDAADSSNYFIVLKVAKSLPQEIGLPIVIPGDNVVPPVETPDNNTGGNENTQTPDNNTGGNENTQTPDNNTGGNENTQTPDNNTSGNENTQTPDNNTGGNENTQKPDNNTGGNQSTENLDNNVGGNEGTETSKPVTGYSNAMAYLGGAFITLGSIFSFKKKKK